MLCEGQPVVASAMSLQPSGRAEFVWLDEALPRPQGRSAKWRWRRCSADLRGGLAGGGPFVWLRPLPVEEGPWLLWWPVSREDDDNGGSGKDQRAEWRMPVGSGAEAGKTAEAAACMSRPVSLQN